MGVVTSGGQKTVLVVGNDFFGIKDGNSGSRISVRWDEGAELRSLRVRVEFIVDFFTDELCQYRQYLLGTRNLWHTCLQEHLQE